MVGGHKRKSVLVLSELEVSRKAGRKILLYDELHKNVPRNWRDVKLRTIPFSRKDVLGPRTKAKSMTLALTEQFEVSRTISVVLGRRDCVAHKAKNYNAA